MKKIDLGQAITIVANLGVITGLAFLAFEIRQNTAQMRAEAAYSVHQDVQRLNEAIYSDGEFAELLVRAEESFDSLDAVEQRRASEYFFSLINLAEFVMGLEEEGLSDVSFRIVDLYIKDFQSLPGRGEFVDAVLRPQNEDESYFRSEELHRRLLDE